MFRMLNRKYTATTHDACIKSIVLVAINEKYFKTMFSITFVDIFVLIELFKYGAVLLIL